MRCPHEVIVTCDTSSENYSAALYDPHSGSQLKTYKHASALGHHSLQLLSDSYLIASHATRPCLHLWPLNSQTPVSNVKLSVPGRVTALSCTSNGFYIAAAIDENIFIWQTCSGLLVNNIRRHYQTINCLVFNSDGSCLASGGEDGLIFVWSLSQITNEKEGKPISEFTSHSLPIKDLYFGQVGSFGRLYSVSLDRTARVYDVYAQQLLLTLIFDFPLTTITADIMENSLFVGSSTGAIVKCNLREPPRGPEHHVSSHGNDKMVVFKGHEGSITSLSVSVDCITLLSGSIDSMVYLWDIPSCQIILTIKHKAPVISAFFATEYDNFGVKNIVPSLKVKSLQKVSTQTTSDFILEVCRKPDDSWLLDFNTSEKSQFSTSDNTSDHKNDYKEALEEIERLKKINSDLYEFSMKKIIKN